MQDHIMTIPYKLAKFSWRKTLNINNELLQMLQNKNTYI